MHDTALIYGRAFFENYLPQDRDVKILDVGSLDVNGSLRSVAPPAASYVGVDLGAGAGVDVVLDDPYALPFADQSFDAVVSTSCFEHDDCFWLTFLEILRVLKEGGLAYLNTPSNGNYHGYPQDNWRFYRDAAQALAKWADRNHVGIKIVESFLGDRLSDIWHDHVMVFYKGEHPPKTADLSKSVRGTPPPAWLSGAAGAQPAATLPELQPSQCPICGGTSVTRRPILWDALVKEWELTPEQRAYVDDQQGLSCTGCGSNLRSMTLALAILRTLSLRGRLADHCAAGSELAQRRILEINEAGHLTPFLRRLPMYLFADYPDHDMQQLQLPDASFDLVIHSDTLEHVPDSIRGLRECHRVLATGGVLAYTIPIIPDRLTRSRAGLPPSYHGGEHAQAEDYLVQREYGGDFWCELFEAGFRDVRLHSILYPASVAIAARKV